MRRTSRKVRRQSCTCLHHYKPENSSGNGAVLRVRPKREILACPSLFFDVPRETDGGIHIAWQLQPRHPLRFRFVGEQRLRCLSCDGSGTRRNSNGY